MRYLDKILNAVESIQEKTGNIQARAAGLILGSGLGPALEHGFHVDTALPYAEIPGFPRSTIPGHEGRLLAGTLSGRPLLVLSGRVHLYEGLDAAQVCFGVRVLAELGVRDLVLTCAAGSLNPLFAPGTLLCLSDHINLSGHNPLRGPHEERLGPRFPDMSRVYDQEWRAAALDAAGRLGVRLEQGVYLQVLGPSLETPAETRAFRLLGADAVGMSLAVEAIAARQAGLRVLGLACLTNQNLPDCMAPVSHELVLARAGDAASELGRLLAGILKQSPGTADETFAAVPSRGRPRGRKQA